MGKPGKLVTAMRPHAKGGFEVIWRETAAARPIGIVPVRSQGTAELLKELLDRGVDPVDAVSRAFRPRRKAAVGDSSTAASKYGQLGAARRNAALTPERRREIAQRAAVSRWGAKAEVVTDGANGGE